MKNKLIVEYNADDGLAFPDNKSKDYVETIIKDFTSISKMLIPLHIVIGTELLVELFRCAVVEKKIKHTKIKFLFKGEIIDIDKYGTCRKYPKGFGDTNMNATKILLAYQHEKALKNRKNKTN